MTEQSSRQALRPSVGGMVSLNIMDEAARLKAKPEWSSEDRLAVAEHRTKGPIAVQVLSGSVRFSAVSKDAELASGSMAALDRNIVHELEALEESIVLLTTAIG
jgi:hypothetical protein